LYTTSLQLNRSAFFSKKARFEYSSTWTTKYN